MKFLGGLLKFLSILLLIIATVACTAIIAIVGVMDDQPDVIVVFALVWVCAVFVALTIWGTGVALSKLAGLHKKMEQMEQQLLALPAAVLAAQASAPAPAPAACEAPTVPAAPVASAASVAALPAVSAESELVQPVVSDAELAPAVMPAAEPVMKAAEKKAAPKWLPAVIIGSVAIVAVAVVVAVVLIVGGKQGQSPDMGQVPAEPQVPAMPQDGSIEMPPMVEEPVVEPPMEEPRDELPADPEAVMIPLGDFIENEHFNMTFDMVELRDEFEYRTSEYSTTSLYVEEGYKLLVLHGHFANHGTSAISSSSFSLEAIVNGEYHVDGYDVRMDFLRNKSFEIDPYTDLDYVIHINIPEKLAEQYENVMFKIGFNSDLSTPVTTWNMDGTTTVEVDNRYAVASDAALMEEMAAAREEAAGSTEENAQEYQPINLGEMVVTPDYEFILLNVEMAYEVLPPNVSSVYSSYVAESGKVFIHVEATVKNTMRRDIRIDELFRASALYDGAYSYDGFTIVDDDNRFDWVGSYVAATPLETIRAHSLIECPVEVDESGKPVMVYLQLGDTTYEYPLR